MSVSMPQYFNIPAFSKACIVFSGAIILAPLCAKKLTLLYTLGTLNCVALSALYDSNSTDNGLFTELTSSTIGPVSYTHLRAHETRHDLVCRLLLEKKKKQ